MRLQILIIGVVDDPEFAGAADFLGLLPNVTIDHVSSVAEGTKREASLLPAGHVAPSPDLIVILERHPDEHSPQEIRRLIEAHPLSRIVCGYGPWSESAARTRAAWPTATWVPAALLCECILTELSVIRGELPPLAITADRADSFQQRYRTESDQQPALESLKVALCIPDAAYRMMLEDELILQSAHLVGTVDDWDLLLFDAHPEVQRMRTLQRLLASRTRADGRVLVLHELATAADREAWSSEALQIRARVQVVSKLAPLSTLINCR